MRLTSVFLLSAAPLCFAQEVQTYRQSNNASNAAIVSARITYTLQTKRKARDVPAALAEVARLPESLVSRESYEQAIKASALNDELRELKTVWYRAAGGQWVVQRMDLRNVDELMSSTGTPPSQRDNVDRTAMIFSGQGFRGQYSALTGVFSITPYTPPSHLREPLLRTPLRLGTVPDATFEKARQTSVADVAVGPSSVMRFTLKTPASETLIDVDPSRDYRYLHLQEQDPAGRKYREEVASDYRKVNGVWIPFRHETIRWDREGKESAREVVLVQEAILNGLMQAGDFEIVLPPGTLVDDVRGRRAQVVTTKVLKVVAIDDLPRLAADLKAEAVPEPPASAPSRK